MLRYRDNSQQNITQNKRQLAKFCIKSFILLTSSQHVGATATEVSVLRVVLLCDLFFGASCLHAVCAAMNKLFSSKGHSKLGSTNLIGPHKA